MTRRRLQRHTGLYVGYFFLRRGTWQQLLSSCGNESQKGPPRSGSAGISVHSYRKGSSERLVVFNYPGPVSSFCEKRIMITLQGCHIKLNDIVSFSSVQFSCSVVSDSLRPHELQHARPPCPSSTPGVYSDSCP